MKKGETLARKRYGHLEPEALIALAEGLSLRANREWRRGPRYLDEAQKILREYERVCDIMKEKGCYDKWWEARMRASAISLEELLHPDPPLSPPRNDGPS